MSKSSEAGHEVRLGMVRQKVLGLCEAGSGEAADLGVCSVFRETHLEILGEMDGI